MCNDTDVRYCNPGVPLEIVLDVLTAASDLVEHLANELRLDIPYPVRTWEMLECPIIFASRAVYESIALVISPQRMFPRLSSPEAKTYIQGAR